ncbi:hypothetical protein GCM10011415_24340 [Salipiger pallidus]|uniref:Uncharacterized protein n=1 Tax=Salipiger pallidus TaxID=1775170 RepID=A0A8J3EGQ2_9RHOB|nr:hypothetical protein [Salipiger pallidus]GGG74941.1 hypothetical protein GCM10011415_24340 [Salipiger pallidus]
MPKSTAKALGVVIWTKGASPCDCRAIIWCEDQGDLALFDSREDGLGLSEPLKEGDLVQFDLAQVSSQRRARNPQKLVRHCFSGLVDALRPVSRPLGLAPVGNVVPFPGR